MCLGVPECATIKGITSNRKKPQTALTPQDFAKMAKLSIKLSIKNVTAVAHQEPAI